MYNADFNHLRIGSRCAECGIIFALMSVRNMREKDITQWNKCHKLCLIRIPVCRIINENTFLKMEFLKKEINSQKDNEKREKEKKSDVICNSR